MNQKQFGVTIKQQTLDDAFLTGPGEELIVNTFRQMALAQGQPDPKTGKPTFPFQIIFGPYTPGTDKQRWADYQRFDWSIRQLPAINAFESDSQDQTSDQGFINGSVTFQVFWPPNQRRSDLARVQKAFDGVMNMFFSSQYVTDMLDELYFHQRPGAKVNGLNEYGKVMTWSPNVEGIVETELCPVTIHNVKYRIDKRAWFRSLEFQNRTKEQPYTAPLSDLTVIGGDYDGVTDLSGNAQVEVEDEITVHNP